MAKETTQFFNDNDNTQFSQGTSISPTSANTKTTNAILETVTSKINKNKNINKVKNLSQDDYEINYSSISPSLTSNVLSSSHNNTNESSESSEDEGYETPAKEPYENKYIKLTTIDALDFLPASDESNALSSDILSIIHKATNLTFVLCLVSSILAALYSFWFINNSWSRFYTLCALFWGYHLYKLNSSSLSLKETINTAKKIAMGIAIYQFFIYISNNVEADLFDRNPLLYAGSVLSTPFLVLLEEILEAYQKENFRKQALLREERKNSQRSLYKAIDRFGERKGLYLRTISDQLRQTTDMAMETLKQLSPPHFLSKPHEQLSACSLSFPTASISAIHNTIKDINYISTHLGTLSLLLFSEQDNQEISHVKREFDIGEIVQHVGDVLAGNACNANVELVIYHVEYGLNHLNVIGDEAAFRHSLLDLLKCIIDGASPGDCVELGLGLQIRESESRGLQSERERTINPHDKVTCTIEIIYNAGVIGSKGSNRSKPVSIIPNANLTHKILSFLGASLKMGEGQEEQNSQRLEISIELEAGSPLAPPNIPSINEESRRRYPHLRITGEPSIEELIKTSQNMRRQRVALHATSKSHFAKHITSCLTTWGTDISHVPIGGEDEFETPCSETPSSLESEAGTLLGSSDASEEYKNHDELQQSLNANLPPTFIIIDDDIETLKQQLTQLGKAPFQLTGMAVRSKRPGQAPTIPSQTTAIIHFTSLANYKSVKDAVQCIISPTAGSFSLPQVLVIPKPAGPRRFLTALHTTINRIVVDPVFMPIATSPMSPSQQDSNGGIKSGPELGTKHLENNDAQFTESPGNYFPPDAASLYRPSTPLASVGIPSINNSPQSPSGNSLLVIPKPSRNPDVQGKVKVVVPPSSPGRSFQSMGPLSPTVVGIGSGTPAINGSPGVVGIGAGLAIGTSPSVPKQPPSPPPPQSPVQKQPSVSQSRFINNGKGIKARSKPKANVDTVIPPVNVLIVEDNPINQAILSTFMKKKKIKYECASNGQEAVDKWQKGGFHMVLMDIQLPVMDGIEATKKIRSLEKSRKIGVFSSTPLTASTSCSSSSSTSASSSVSSTPVSTPMQQTPPSTPDLGLPVVILALTASSLSIDRQNALAAGCNDFLTKPVSLVWLEKKIQEWGSMQALVDFDGWKKWKKFEYELEDKKGKKSEQITNVIVKKSNSEDIGKHPKQKQASQVDSTSENNKSSIKISSRSTLPTKMPSNSNGDNEVLNTPPNQKNTLISPLQRSLTSSPTSPTSTSTFFPSLLQTPSGGIKISPPGVVSSRQNIPSPPPIVIKPSTPQSSSKASVTEPNTESNITSPKICPISTASNMKNNLINNNLLTITTNTSTPSTINTINESSSQPSTPLSTTDPQKIVRKRGSTVSSVTGVSVSVGDQNVI